ncbi:MAG: imidazolonepropionase [Planctomycetota bacterium]|jgi:imidazolonepropionase|nr:imidazolonepropionase [Planctomycetota bacterium]
MTDSVSIAVTNSRLLTLSLPGTGDAPRRGSDLAELGILDPGWILVRQGRIADLGGGTPPNFGPETRLIDARGRVVMPALVDCHTHACFVGDRNDEFEARLAGAGYLEILAAGGGIMSTVRSVRGASESELVDALVHRLEQTARLGTGTIEVKSGYGLEPETELKMLRAIRTAAERSPQIVVPTFLGAHALDSDAEDSGHGVERIIAEALPAAAAAFPGIVCDAYCEDGAWSLSDCRRLFEAAIQLGCPVRVHTDQFNCLGMTQLAIELGARSVDHLEATTPKDLQRLAASATIGVLLPASGFSLDDRYAPGRELVDLGGAVAVASNLNPGSAPSPSLTFAMALACRKCRLRPAEAITAATFNAACVLGLQDEVGSLEIGKRADLLMLDTADERTLGVEIAGPGPVGVMLEGRWFSTGWPDDS